MIIESSWMGWWGFTSDGSADFEKGFKTESDQEHVEYFRVRCNAYRKMQPVENQRSGNKRGAIWWVKMGGSLEQIFDDEVEEKLEQIFNNSNRGGDAVIQSKFDKY